jgi:hypothetical protein
METDSSHGHMLLELIHDRVRDGHVLEHALQFGCKLASTLSLKKGKASWRIFVKETEEKCQIMEFTY